MSSNPVALCQFVYNSVSFDKSDTNLRNAWARPQIWLLDSSVCVISLPWNEVISLTRRDRNLSSRRAHAMKGRNRTTSSSEKSRSLVLSLKQCFRNSLSTTKKLVADDLSVTSPSGFLIGNTLLLTTPVWLGRLASAGNSELTVHINSLICSGDVDGRLPSSLSSSTTMTKSTGLTPRKLTKSSFKSS